MRDPEPIEEIQRARQRWRWTSRAGEPAHVDIHRPLTGVAAERAAALAALRDERDARRMARGLDERRSCPVTATSGARSWRR